MVQRTRKSKIERTVLAPQNKARLLSGSVLSVKLGPDEDVHWQWTHYQNGKSAVTGYTITKKKRNRRSGK
jgi:hypothetical protein